MLLALLYTRDGYLQAAAWACDQQPYGDRYWMEIHPQPVPITDQWQTAHVNVEDGNLARRLLQMDFPNGYAAARCVDRYAAPVRSGDEINGTLRAAGPVRSGELVRWPREQVPHYEPTK